MQGQELAQKRKLLGLTQVQLAEALDVTETFIGMMERGERPVQTRTELAVRCLIHESKVKKCAKCKALGVKT